MISALGFKLDKTLDRVPFPLAIRMGALTGWRRAWTLIVLGALAALALPPIGFVPILLISIPGLIWIWDGARTLKSAFLLAWWWVLGFYSVGFYWLANALLIDADSFGWMVPFATLGMSALNAVFPAAGFAVVYLIKARGPSRIIWIAVFWTVSEWLRTFVFTGFPWNPMGSVWDQVLPVLQAGSLFGVHGLSFVTVLSFGLLACLVVPGRNRAILAAVAIGIPLGLGIWGQIRLAQSPTTFVPGIKLRLVQPMASLTEKWKPQNREPALLDLVDLSRGDGYQDITHVIWPESAAPFDLVGDAVHRNLAAVAAPVNGLVLAGSPRFKPVGDGTWQYWNSLIVLDVHGTVQGVYDKAHLVPFGEYIPLRWLLPIPHAVAAMGDFSAGPGPRTLALPGLPPVGPAICYESVFPGKVIMKGPDRPQWMVVITNDGWFGNSTGPYQHFAAARMRAIEEGLPVARAANTGISGVIDAYGRTVAKLELGKRGVVDSFLPNSTRSITAYGEWGDLTVVLLLGVSALIAGALGRYN